MITIDKQYLKYNPFEFAIYTSLRMTYNNDICKNCITDIDTIVYNLFGYFDDKCKYKREFSSTMKDMIDENKIKCLKKQGYKYVLDISNYDISDKSEHISVDINKLRVIFNINSRYSTLELKQYKT